MSDKNHTFGFDYSGVIEEDHVDMDDVGEVAKHSLGDALVEHFEEETNEYTENRTFEVEVSHKRDESKIVIEVK